MEKFLFEIDVVLRINVVTHSRVIYVVVVDSSVTDALEGHAIHTAHLGRKERKDH